VTYSLRRRFIVPLLSKDRIISDRSSINPFKFHSDSSDSHRLLASSSKCDVGLFSEEKTTVISHASSWQDRGPTDTRIEASRSPPERIVHVAASARPTPVKLFFKLEQGAFNALDDRQPSLILRPITDRSSGRFTRDRRDDRQRALTAPSRHSGSFDRRERSRRLARTHARIANSWPAMCAAAFPPPRGGRSLGARPR